MKTFKNQESRTMNSDFIGMMMAKEESSTVPHRRMKLVDRYEEASTSVKVSFNRRKDRNMCNIFIGKDICSELKLDPGSYVSIKTDGRIFEIRKTKKTARAYKIQEIEPSTRNNYRIQFTWRHFWLKSSDCPIRIVDHFIQKGTCLQFDLDSKKQQGVKK